MGIIHITRNSTKKQHLESRNSINATQRNARFKKQRGQLGGSLLPPTPNQIHVTLRLVGVR